MKKLFTLIFILFSFFAKADYWTQKANFPGLGLEASFSFTIGNKGYAGCGKDISGIYHNDFWEYDPSTNVWTQKANFGGMGRFTARGFSIGNKGYAGLGADDFSTFQDFWEYDPLTNAWTQKANFGGGSRATALGFSIGNWGYIGTGRKQNQYKRDLWQYIPATDSWVQKTSLPLGFERDNSVCFVIGNSAFVIAGLNSVSLLSDLWEYNSISDTWTQKANFNPRCCAAAFSICDKGYCGTGQYAPGLVYTNDLWQYNPLTNLWVQKTNFSGLSRDNPAFFSIGNKAYLGSGGEELGPFYSDFWEYTPDSACATGIEELTITNLEFTITPNPAKDFIAISYPLNVKENLYITITDNPGKKVYQSKLLTPDLRLPVSNFRKGIYLVELTNGKEKEMKKFVKE